MSKTKKGNNNKSKNSNKGQVQVRKKPFGGRGKKGSSNRNPYKSKSNRNLQGGQFPTIMQPRKMGNVFSTYTRVGKDALSFCVRVSPTLCGLGTIVCPVHPLFYPGRMFNTIINASEFTIVSCTMHYVPIVGTDEGGNVTITDQAHTIDVTQNQVLYLESLSQLGADISPTWAPSHYQFRNNDHAWYPINPLTVDNIPGNIFVGALSPENNHALNFYGNLFIEMSIKLRGSSLQNQITPVGYSQIVTTAAGGVSMPVLVTGTTKLIVSSSTATNIDCGEFVVIPPIIQGALAQTSIFPHNGENVNYAQVGDQGTFSGMSFVCN